MGSTKNLLLAVFMISFSFVENAPSTINGIKTILQGNDLHSRLVFVSRHGENINGNSQLPVRQWSTISPEVQKRISSAEELSGPVFASNDSPQDVNQQSALTGLTRMDDERQNWGLVIEDKEVTEEESYYNRPLNLPKVIVNKVKSQKLAKVGNKTPTAVNVPTQPSACDTAVVTCCAKPSALKQCFVSVGCPNVTEDMFAYLCSNDNIKKIIQDFAKYYKGTDNK